MTAPALHATLHGEPLLFDLARYEATLAPWAEHPSRSRGRAVPESGDGRTPHQRDRDRIVHATAFRRLRHKTQVFVAHEGDHYRTRLTHTLEVAQVARSIARALRLNEDLAEAVALAHDLGHPPFGHAGEAALDERMEGHGGFDHNVQSLRVVTDLERRYLGRDGLNLTWETLEGLAKHNGPTDAPHPVVAALGLPPAMGADRHASLEAQVAAIADDIAYNAHDIDDGLRAGLFDFAELSDLPRMRPLLDGLDPDHRRSVYELMRRQITMMIRDVTHEAVRRLTALGPRVADDVRAADRPVIAFSGECRLYDAEVRGFLTERVYRHRDVAQVMARARDTLGGLFDRLVADPALLPPEWRDECAGAEEGAEEGARHRTVADYIAGMTDTYAGEAHARLCGTAAV